MARDSQDLQAVRLDAEAEIIRRLAEKPCARCKGQFAVGLGAPCPVCHDADGKPTGLAFEWASRPCPKCIALCKQQLRAGLPCHCRAFASQCCNGSGRVPKADLGLEDVLSHAPSLGDFLDILTAVKREHSRVINEGGPPNYTLAALRVVKNA